MGKLNQFAVAYKKNSEFMKKESPLIFDKIASINSLYLPLDIPGSKYDKRTYSKDTDWMNKFYEELGMPFFHSLTKKQIKKLGRLQLDAWKLHVLHRLLLILKSQKIGISSLCILITMYHALTDCMGMELIINAQSDDQAKTHAQDFRRIIAGSPKYKDYLITKAHTSMGILKDEVTKVHTIYLHNPINPRLPTKIIVVGMSPGAMLSHKRVGFIWSSDSTISQLTSSKKFEVWAAMLSRLANSLGPCIVECPARDPSGPVYDTFERYENQLSNKEKIDPENDFHVFKFMYKLGLRDKFFTPEFIVSERRRLGPLFGTFYEADFFASGNTWYEKQHFENTSTVATDLILGLNKEDDFISDLTDD